MAASEQKSFKSIVMICVIFAAFGFWFLHHKKAQSPREDISQVTVPATQAEITKNSPPQNPKINRAPAEVPAPVVNQGHDPDPRKRFAPLRAPVSMPRAARLEILRKAPRGQEILHAERPYQYLPTVRARLRSVAGALPDGSEVLDSKGGYELYTDPTAPDANPAAIEGDLHPTVLNLKTGELGILTGEYKVKLNDFANVDSVARDFGLSLVRRFDAISVAIYLAPENYDLVSGLSRMLRDPRIQRADLEIIENRPVSQ